MRDIRESSTSSSKAESQSGKTVTSPLGGEYFGEYQILSEIARGGMGIVYRAQKKGVKRIIALKVLLGGAMSDQSQVKRFLREAKATASLNHPNIIPIYDMGEINGYHFFTMKYVEGTTFQQIIDDDSVDINEKIKIFCLICSALEHAHKKKNSPP